MIPVVFINCTVVPFLAGIISGRKTFETRTRDMLRSLVGRRVYLAETGRGRPVVRCSAVLCPALKITDKKTWSGLRSRTRVPRGSQYDWTQKTTAKYCYNLLDVQPCSPFPVPEGVRHGRVWMEYNPVTEEE